MNTYINQVCERCGSKKALTKSKKEKLVTYSGVQVLEVSQVICTNKQCQARFEDDLARETLVREEAKQKRIEQDIIRKEEIVQKIAASRALFKKKG